jgi:predicted enzyme related to lactoylglutathione lyase
MFNLNSFLLFSENPKELVAFYKKVLKKEPDWGDDNFSGFQIGSCMFMIGKHDKVHGKNTMPERMLFNFVTHDVKEECKRLKKLGVEVIQEPYHPDEAEMMTIATFADPDGNYFQFATPMQEQAPESLAN